MKFPDTFLYSISWEDSLADKPVLDIQHTDKVLTLTGGGDNVFNLLLDGANEVVCTDINSAQYHLMELKCKTITHGCYGTLWKLFGTGKYLGFSNYLNNVLYNVLPSSSMDFWKRKTNYFKDSIYFHGYMGSVVKFINRLGLKSLFKNQKNHWKYKMSISISRYLLYVFGFCVGNTRLMWRFFGVPDKQVKMIFDDNRSIGEYLVTSLVNAFTSSDIMTDNHYYYVVLNGNFSKHNCPEYLKEHNYINLRNKVANRLTNVNDSILNVLRQNDTDKFDKVILMDHMDWMDETYVCKLCSLLKTNLSHNGKIIFRSSSVYPWYIDIFSIYGFNSINISNHLDNPYMDRINTYASFWVVEHFS